MRTKLIITTAVVLAAGAGGAAVAIGSGDDGETSATGPSADRARSAALKLYPGATANAVERDGENGATWEVEITRADGKTVDVYLDADHRLIVVEGDGSEDEGPEG